jgi:hypothetical protein
MHNYKAREERILRGVEVDGEREGSIEGGGDKKGGEKIEVFDK